MEIVELTYDGRVAMIVHSTVEQRKLSSQRAKGRENVRKLIEREEREERERGSGREENKK